MQILWRRLLNFILNIQFSILLYRPKCRSIITISGWRIASWTLTVYGLDRIGQRQAGQWRVNWTTFLCISSPFFSIFRLSVLPPAILSLSVSSHLSWIFGSSLFEYLLKFGGSPRSLGVLLRLIRVVWIDRHFVSSVWCEIWRLKLQVVRCGDWWRVVCWIYLSRFDSGTAACVILGILISAMTDSSSVTPWLRFEKCCASDESRLRLVWRVY